MKHIHSSPLSLLAVLVIGFLCPHQVQSVQLIDDRAITVHSAREVTEKRRALIQYLWGAEGYPSRRLPTAVSTNVASPVKHLVHVARVDELRIDLAPGLQG